MMTPFCSLIQFAPWQPFWLDRREDPARYDLIGDIHGCADELEELLDLLGYRVTWTMRSGRRTPQITAPSQRKLVFLGDLVDRGPRTPDVLRIADTIQRDDVGYVVMGNHDHQLLRWCSGYPVAMNSALATSIEQVLNESPEFRAEAQQILERLPSYILLDQGKLIVCHTGIDEEMIGQDDLHTHETTVYGPPTPPPNGPHVEHWSAHYTGTATIAYGHYSVLDVARAGNTLCLDTACVYGGKLSAMRWPEGEILSVPSRTKFQSARPHPRPLPANAEDFLAHLHQFSEV